MRAWVGRIRRMRMSDYLTASEVVALAVWVEIAIRVMPVSRVLERMTGDSSPAASDEAAAAHAYRRLVRFVAVAYDLLPLPGTCLRQSLVLYGLLERRGMPSRVRFGVERRGRAIAAHAWVECHGVAPADCGARYTGLATPAEELPHILDEQLGLFQRGEVPAARHIG